MSELTFLIFIFPIIGILLEFFVTKKIISITLAISIFFLSPLLIGYNYIYPLITMIFILIVLSCLYSLSPEVFENKIAKIISSIVISVCLFFFLAFITFMDSFSGTQKIEQTWHIDNYKIEYIRDQGFSGRPLMKYELKKYGIVPIFIKKLDESVEDDSIKSCIIKFGNDISFNRCNEKIEKTN